MTESAPEQGWTPLSLEPRRAPAPAAANGALRVGLVSLGCPKNLVDSEVMLGHLRRRGHEIAVDPRQADVIVVNTCAFIDRAKQESIDTILEMAREKESGQAHRLVVTGCLAQRYDAELRREIPEIDATLGIGQVEDIASAVEGAATVTDAERLPTWVYDHTTPRVLSTAGHTAYLKISEGCDYTCSFCIIPSLRGKHRSRPPEDIVAEARSLAARGVRELVLVAQDSTRYGLDRGVRDGLADLLRRLGRIDDGLRWIRVMYAYPATLTDGILDAIASEPKVVKYLDLPLQHASDATLERMKRPRGKGNLLGLLERIRSRVPGVALRSSFIVGFPGESSEEFDELLDFVATARFDNVGVFTYSDEEGTTAFELPGRVASRVKESRRRRLLALQQRISARRNEARVGETVEVLVEGAHEESDLLLRGRLSTQAPEIDGGVIINDGAAERGEFVMCEITEAHPYDLVGRIVS